MAQLLKDGQFKCKPLVNIKYAQGETEPNIFFEDYLRL